MGVPLLSMRRFLMVESFGEVWLATPLGVVADFLGERSDGLWAEAKAAGGLTAEYERMESLRSSLGRVVGWLATTEPPLAVLDGSQELPRASARRRARGRICFKCRGQIRSTQKMATVCPVWMPGLPIHDDCFEELDREFGGKQ